MGSTHRDPAFDPNNRPRVNLADLERKILDEWRLSKLTQPEGARYSAQDVSAQGQSVGTSRYGVTSTTSDYLHRSPRASLPVSAQFVEEHVGLLPNSHSNDTGLQPLGKQRGRRKRHSRRQRHLDSSTAHITETSSRFLQNISSTSLFEQQQPDAELSTSFSNIRLTNPLRQPPISQASSYGRSNLNSRIPTGIPGTTGLQSSFQQLNATGLGRQETGGRGVDDSYWRTRPPALLASQPRTPPLPVILVKSNRIRPDDLQFGWIETSRSPRGFTIQDEEKFMNTRFHPRCHGPEILFQDAADARGFSYCFEDQADIVERSKTDRRFRQGLASKMQKALTLGIISVDDYNEGRFPLAAKPSAVMTALLGAEETEQMYASAFTPDPSLLFNCKERTINGPRLLQVIRDNRPLISMNGNSTYIHNHRAPEVQFTNEILYRCIYINSFLKTKRNPLGKDARHLFWNEYYPALGPNIELDCWIYEKGILQDPNSTKQHFNHLDNDLILMYGFASVDLRFLQNNHHTDERQEQLRTLESYHILKIWLGDDELKDLTEQMRFCFYAMRDSKNWPPTTKSGPNARFSPPGRKYHHDPNRLASVKARKREFKIAKIMVDRIWEEIGENEGSRVSTICLRQKTIEDTTGRRGDWDKLGVEDKTRLLGGPTQYHPKSDDYDDLAKEWLQPRPSPARARARTQLRAVPQPSGVPPARLGGIYQSPGLPTPPVSGGYDGASSGPLGEVTHTERSRQMHARFARSIQPLPGSHAEPDGTQTNALGTSPRIRAAQVVENNGVQTETGARTATAVVAWPGDGRSRAAPRAAGLPQPRDTPVPRWKEILGVLPPPAAQESPPSFHQPARADSQGNMNGPARARLGGPLARVSRFFPGPQRPEAAQGRRTANWAPGPEDFELDDMLPPR